MLHSSELVRPFQVVNPHWDTSGENSEKKIIVQRLLIPKSPPPRTASPPFHS